MQYQTRFEARNAEVIQNLTVLRIVKRADHCRLDDQPAKGHRIRPKLFDPAVPMGHLEPRSLYEGNPLILEFNNKRILLKFLQ